MSREEKFSSIINNIDSVSSKYEEKLCSNIDFCTYKEPQEHWLAEKYSKLKFSSYKPFQFVDGEGVRCSIYLSGCLFACKECFNESIQNFNVGEIYTQEIEDIIIADLAQSYVQGLTILGGEPFLNTQVALRLCERVRKEFGETKDIWIYSGYTYEQLQKASSDKQKLLAFCDILVDGPFIVALKDFNLKFRGSSNQRIIDLKKSKEQQKVVLYLE